MGLNRFLAPRSAVPISSGLPVPTYSSVSAATATHVYQSGQPYSNAIASTTIQSFGNQAQYPHPSGRHDNWAYQTPFTSAQPPHNSYGYGYYPTGATGTGSSLYNGYGYSQPQYAPTHLQWQQPYQNQGYYRHGASQQHTQPPGGDPSFKGASSLYPDAPVQVPPTAQSPVQTHLPAVSVDTEPVSNNLGILASLQPAQIEELLRNNPQLRDVVVAAINEAKKALPSSS
jgi:hypothetical protein